MNIPGIGLFLFLTLPPPSRKFMRIFGRFGGERFEPPESIPDDGVFTLKERGRVKRDIVYGAA